MMLLAQWFEDKIIS